MTRKALARRIAELLFSLSTFIASRFPRLIPSRKSPGSGPCRALIVDGAVGLTIVADLDRRSDNRRIGPSAGHVDPFPAQANDCDEV